MSVRSQEIEGSLKGILGEIGSPARLVAVSKTYPAGDVESAYKVGQRDFGENKVQELTEKAASLAESCPEIRWHFIGNLQSNKINILLKTPNLVSIHSIDSIKLLNKLLSKSPDTKIGIFLQYNTSGERQKSGFENYQDLLAAANALKSAEASGSNFFFQGLMTMGSIRSEDFENAAKSCFEKLKELKSRLEEVEGFHGLELSMGMSSDFQIALECGSDWVRVGSAVFGKRKS